jgi:hypothetical protein
LDTLSIFMATMGIAFAPGTRSVQFVFPPPIAAHAPAVELDQSRGRFTPGGFTPGARLSRFAFERRGLVSDSADAAGWRSVGKGAATGFLIGVATGVFVGSREEKNCTGSPCGSMTAIRGVEFGLLGALLGAAVGGRWPH